LFQPRFASFQPRMQPARISLQAQPISSTSLSSPYAYHRTRKARCCLAKQPVVTSSMSAKARQSRCSSFASRRRSGCRRWRSVWPHCVRSQASRLSLRRSDGHQFKKLLASAGSTVWLAAVRDGLQPAAINGRGGVIRRSPESGQLKRPRWRDSSCSCPTRFTSRFLPIGLW